MSWKVGTWGLVDSSKQHNCSLFPLCPAVHILDRKDCIPSFYLSSGPCCLWLSFVSQKMRLKLNRKSFNEVLETRNEIHVFWQGRVGVLSHFQCWNLPVSALTGDIGACCPPLPTTPVIISFSCMLETTANCCSIAVLFCYLHCVSCVCVSIASEFKYYFYTV